MVYFEHMFDIQPSFFTIALWVLLKGIGVIYLIAFGSLWVQVKGLYGQNGILPIAHFLNQVKSISGPVR